MARIRQLSLLAAVAAACIAGPASATMITDRAALGGDDQLRWGQLPTTRQFAPLDVLTDDGAAAILSNPVTASGV
jgi:hypothetical protein